VRVRTPACLSRRAAVVYAVAAVCAAAVPLAGCAKIDKALGQQWAVVQFAPGTTLSAARHAAQACSHLPGLRLLPVRPLTPSSGVVESVRYNATNASDADLARLQQCLMRFPAFQNLTVTQPGDS
jgi:hypothetical protein